MKSEDMKSEDMKKKYFTHYNLPPIWEESSARMIWWPWLKGRVVTWPVSGFISMVIGCAVRPCGRSWWVATSAKVCTAWVASCWPILGIYDQKKKSKYIVNAVPHGEKYKAWSTFFLWILPCPLTAAFLLWKNFSNFVKWPTITPKIYDWSCLTYLKVSFTDLIQIATLFMLTT